MKAKANTKGNKGVVAIGDGNDGTDMGGMGDSPLAVVKQKEAKLAKGKNRLCYLFQDMYTSVASNKWISSWQQRTSCPATPPLLPVPYLILQPRP